MKQLARKLEDLQKIGYYFDVVVTDVHTYEELLDLELYVTVPYDKERELKETVKGMCNDETLGITSCESTNTYSPLGDKYMYTFRLTVNM